VRNCIVRREAVVEGGVELEECIIMDYSRIRRGVCLRRVIVDYHNVIEPTTRIGYDKDEDTRRYPVSPSEIVVVPRGRIRFYARDSGGKGVGYDE